MGMGMSKKTKPTHKHKQCKHDGKQVFYDILKYPFPKSNDLYFVMIFKL